MTANSVTMRSTGRAEVSGSVHLLTIFGLPLAVCCIATITGLAPVTNWMIPGKMVPRSTAFRCASGLSPMFELADSASGNRGVVRYHCEIAFTLANEFIDQALRRPNAHQAPIMSVAPSGTRETASTAETVFMS